MTKERPILFSGEMVKAILDGRKTQTRRVLKPQPVGYPNFYTLPITFGLGLFPSNGSKVQGSLGHFYPPDLELYSVEVLKKYGGLAWHHEGFSPPNRWTCPYGKPGDRLWVRESWYSPGRPLSDCLGYVANGDHPHGVVYRVRPSIHMPRVASRINLEITNVRIERLQDISRADVLAEGIDLDPDNVPDDIVPFFHAEARGEYKTQAGLDEAWDAYARAGYAKLWDKINGKKYPWESNPWVWVVEFKKASGNLANAETRPIQPEVTDTTK